MHRKLLILLFFCWLPLPAQAIEAKFWGRQDTIRLKRIVYTDKYHDVYTVEGSTLHRELKYRHIIKDIPLKKYKKAIREYRGKVFRKSFWQGILVFGLFFIVPVGLIIGVFSFVFLSSLKIALRLAIFLALCACGVVIGRLSVRTAILLSQSEHDEEGFLRGIIDEYNKEVEAQK